MQVRLWCLFCDECHLKSWFDAYHLISRFLGYLIRVFRLRGVLLMS
jgi:hypothetical protein